MFSLIEFQYAIYLLLGFLFNSINVFLQSNCLKLCPILYIIANAFWEFKFGLSE